ncbi:transmembrane amino acid transporter protein-domain-containing protein [Lenzites betulinus]|nr:transmembrane amino acid transporter protein-domain-containing protein [Lenzites betulinus]
MPSKPVRVFLSFSPPSVRLPILPTDRRAQAQHSDFVAGSVSSSSGRSGPQDTESVFPDDLEDGYEEEEDLIEEVPRSVRERARSTGEDALLANIQWDEDLTPGPSTAERTFDFATPTIPSPRYPRTPAYEDVPTPRAAERTPLLVKQPAPLGLPVPAQSVREGPQYAAIQRRVSRVSVRSKAEPKVQHLGQSTFAQTLLNAVAVLFGIGMLSEPLAFSYAGWIGGSFIIISYGYISCYTAKILARIVLSDPHIRSYADIGRKAFGARSSPFISAIFGLELFTVCVALVTLYADSLYAVIPHYSPNTYKIIGLVILIPAVLMPLSVLSYASIAGIFSLVAIIGIILFDGFTKFDSPGSLWKPADMSLGIDNYRELGVAFGLFMAGFSGHAVIPTLARDMIDPSRFDEMINWAFAIATGIYAVLGVAGYMMFGNSVSDEFSQDLMKHNVHPSLNTVALWGLVITPLSKFALAARPLNVTLEVLLGIDTSGIAAASEHGTTLPNAGAPLRTSPRAVKSALIALERAALTAAAVAVSIVVPEFAAVMAVLGSTFSFVLCVIGPVLAKIALSGSAGTLGVGAGAGAESWWRRCGWWDGALLVVSASMSMWGTACAFMTAAPVPEL